MAPSRTPRCGVVAKCLAATTVLALTVALQPAGKTFVTPAAPQGAHVPDAARASVQRAIPTSRPAVAAQQKAAGWSSLGSAALLCATAAIALQSLQQRGSSSKSAVHVVACQASAAPVAQYVAPAPVAVPAPVSTASDVAPAAAAPSLLDTPVPTVVAQAPAPEALPAPVAQPAAAAPLESFFIGAGEEEEVPTVAAGAARRPARFVGGVRLPSAHRAGRSSSARAARAARKAVGARLMTPVQYEEAPAPSFDSSKIRIQIQVGLRTGSRVNSEQAREFKAPAAHDGGSAAAKILNIFTTLSMHYDHKENPAHF